MALFSFGGSAEKTKSSEESEFEKSGESTTSEKLNLDQAAIEKIISDVLGGPQGLASIFGGEQVAGIFDSSVAAQASGDLVTNLIGELSKLTAERVSTTKSSERGTASGTSSGSKIGAEAGIKIGG